MVAHKTYTTSTREREEHCRSQFEGFLRGHLPGARIDWEYVPEIEQPPDYYLTLDGQRYAVEITGLMPFYTVNGRRLEEAAVHSSLWRLVEGIEKDALAEGVLEGEYTILFIQPIPDRAGTRRQLRAQVFDYLQRTRSMPTCPYEVIIPYACLIGKTGTARRAIHGQPPGGGSGTVHDDVRQLLANALATKLEKLKAKKLDVPIIVLLENYHELATPKDYYDSAQGLSLADEFHTVYLVERDSGMVLRSRYKDW